MTLRDFWLGIAAGLYMVVLLVLLVRSAPAQTNEPPEPFLAPVVHQVLADCTYTNQTHIGRELCWKTRFRDNPEFRAALKDAGWRLVRLWFSGELKEIEVK